MTRMGLQHPHYHVVTPEDRVFHGDPDKCPFCSPELKQANKRTRQRFARMRASAIKDARGTR